MPVYEYTCHACGHDFEELTLSMGDGTVVSCPSCSSERVDRRLSVFAARQGAARSATTVPAGGCQRCGDPNGPCAL